MKPALSFLFIFSTLLTGTSVNTCKNGPYILSQSVALHDPQGIWGDAEFDMVIEEPRVQQPTRASKVKLNVENGSFEMERARGEHVTTHLVDALGQARSLLDGQAETDSTMIATYFLQPERNPNYRNYYRFMYGLPMILETPEAKMGKVGSEEFDGKNAIHIDFELTQPMISKNWRVYFEPESYRLLGIKTLDNPEEGEYLIFNGSAQLGTMNLPRFRHWHDSQTDEYLGSDIVIK